MAYLYIPGEVEKHMLRAIGSPVCLCRHMPGACMVQADLGTGALVEDPVPVYQPVSEVAQQGRELTTDDVMANEHHSDTGFPSCLPDCDGVTCAPSVLFNCILYATAISLPEPHAHGRLIIPSGDIERRDHADPVGVSDLVVRQWAGPCGTRSSGPPDYARDTA